MLLVALRTWAYLVVVISSLITAYNLDQELGPPGPLGVSLDYQFATSGSHDPARPFLRNWVFNSHIIFNQDVSTITDGQLVQIAIDAYGEIDAVQKQYQLNKGKTTPRVMSILAFDSEIILVSSQKGSASFMTDFGNSKVRDSLQRCELMYANTASTILQAGHKNGASCGEVMAAHLFYQMYPEKNLADMKAVEVSIASHALDEDKSKSLQVLDPCPGRVEGYWGCDKFTKDQNWRVIAQKTEGEPYDLAILAGGVKGRDVLTVGACNQLHTRRWLRKEW